MKGLSAKEIDKWWMNLNSCLVGTIKDGKWWQTILTATFY